MRTRCHSRPTTLACAIWLTISAPSILPAQTASALSFDAISIKPSPKWTRGTMPPIRAKSGGPGTGSPTHVTYRNIPLRDLVREAYNVVPYLVAGPSWLVDVKYLETDTFDIDISVPPATTKEQYAEMLRNAVATRFDIKTHRERRETPSYTLVVASRGHKLTRSPALAEIAPEDPATAVANMGKMDKDGFLVVPASHSGLLISPSSNRFRAKFMRQTMAQFAEWLAAVHVKHPVADGTGLTGEFDFMLEYAPELSGSVDTTAAPEILTAIQSQLGLRLSAGKAEAEVLVIDRASRMPSAN